MPIISVDVPDSAVPGVVKALMPFGSPEVIKGWAPIDLTPVHEQIEADEDQAEFEALAQRIVEVLRPQANQPLRRDSLRALLGYHDTFWDQKGVADPSLRNGIAAISKAL